MILEYAETLAPAGDPSFQADDDRAAIVTLHRWSFLPEIERGDNVVLLVAENLTELSPKLVSNPKVAVVEVPMPDRERQARRGAARRPAAARQATRIATPRSPPASRSIQIAAILAPPPAGGGRSRRARGVHRRLLGSGAGCRRSARTSSPRSPPGWATTRSCELLAPGAHGAGPGTSVRADARAARPTV